MAAARELPPRVERRRPATTARGGEARGEAGNHRLGREGRLGTLPEGDRRGTDDGEDAGKVTRGGKGRGRGRGERRRSATTDRCQEGRADIYGKEVARGRQSPRGGDRGGRGYGGKGKGEQEGRPETLPKGERRETGEEATTARARRGRGAINQRRGPGDKGAGRGLG